MILGALLIVGVSVLFTEVFAWIMRTLEELGGRNGSNNRQRKR